MYFLTVFQHAWHRFWIVTYFSMHSSSYLHGFGIDFDHLYCLRCSNGSTEDYINIEIYCFYRFRCASHIIKHPIASIRDFPPFPDTLFLPPTIPPRADRRQPPLRPTHSRTAKTAPQPPHRTSPSGSRAGDCRFGISLSTGIVKRWLQVSGARPTREQGHLSLTGRQMRRPEAGLHRQTR